jgi:hypothetical protein
MTLAILAAVASVGCRHTGRTDCVACESRSSIAFAEGSSPGIEGRVLSVEAFRPLASAIIQIEPGNVTAVTDSTGIFRFRGLRPGRYVIEAGMPGRETTRDTLEYGGDDLSILVALAKPRWGLRECFPIR